MPRTHEKSAQRAIVSSQNSGIVGTMRTSAFITIANVLMAGALAACSADTPQNPRMPRGGAAGSAGTAGANTGAGAGATAGSGTAGTFGNTDASVPPITSAGTGVTGVCENLQCRQHTCAGGTTTTVSGKVFDPAGTNPLYNVVVYVPNEPVLPMPSGATCDACDSLYTGNPIATALTDASGAFVLQNVPDGADIPLVVQVGKWRRQFTLPSVAQCVDNPQPDGMLRLPRNRMEGDIPKIAISTGSADTLECLLRRIGIDAAEYGPAGGENRIQIFQGSARVGGGGFFGGGGDAEVVPNTDPAAPSSAVGLWNHLDNMMPYDIVLLSCEGQETLAMNQQAMQDYANAGGRVFASHFHYSWFNTGPYGGANLASWTPGSNDLGDIQGSIVTTLPNGDPFPKGEALAAWLGNVGALQGGLLPIQEARHNADVTPEHLPSQSWILAGPSSQAPGASQYFSFNTPIDANNDPDGVGFCGRVVFSDLHVGAASGDDAAQPVPAGCTDRALSPQEAALEFMLFDLSSCVTPDDVPPAPPVVE